MQAVSPLLLSLWSLNYNKINEKLSSFSGGLAAFISTPALSNLSTNTVIL